MNNLYADIERFLKLDDLQLEYVLAAWCQYRAAEGGLIELLVDHVKNMDDFDKRPYFEAMRKKIPWVQKYPHHVKAITVASCKYKQAMHPLLVMVLLDSNRDITRPALDNILKQYEPQPQPEA